MYSDSVWDPGTSLGITEPTTGSASLRIYPNPARDRFTCSIENTDWIKPQVEIYNILGERLVADFNLSDHKLDVNVGSFSNGFYIIRIIDAGKIWSGKLMLQK